VRCVAAEIRFTNSAAAHKKARIPDQPAVARYFWRATFGHKLKAIFQLADHGPSQWMAGACLRIFSETLEMVMTIPPRTAGPDLSELLHFRPGIIADPVPWWLFQHLDKGAINELAKISLTRQKEELAAHAKAVDAAIKAIGGG
jgi:hypothetical protein